QKLPIAKRWQIAESLLSHAEDIADPNLPLMYWYGIEPLAADDPTRALELAANAKVPQLLPFMVRRIGSSGSPEAVARVVSALAKADDAKVQLAYVKGIRDALKGRPQVQMPAAWPETFTKLAASKDAELRNQAVALAVTFGDVRAFDELRRVITAATADL